MAAATRKVFLEKAKPIEHPNKSLWLFTVVAVVAICAPFAYGFLVARPIALANQGQPQGSFTVSAEQYGGEWPFERFTTAMVACRMERVGGEDRPLVTVSLGNTTYGLNGAAMGAGGYPDPRDLRKRDEWGYLSIGAGVTSNWIDRALSDCPSA